MLLSVFYVFLRLTVIGFEQVKLNLYLWVSIYVFPLIWKSCIALSNLGKLTSKMNFFWLKKVVNFMHEFYKSNVKILKMFTMYKFNENLYAINFDIFGT